MLVGVLATSKMDEVGAESDFYHSPPSPKSLAVTRTLSIYPSTHSRSRSVAVTAVTVTVSVWLLLFVVVVVVVSRLRSIQFNSSLVGWFV